MPRRPSTEDHINRLEQQRNKTLPPGSRWHQYWCAIFQGKSCDCDDGGRRLQPKRLSPDKGGASSPRPTRQRKKELHGA